LPVNSGLQRGAARKGFVRRGDSYPAVDSMAGRSADPRTAAQSPWRFFKLETGAASFRRGFLAEISPGKPGARKSSTLERRVSFRAEKMGSWAGFNGRIEAGSFTSGAAGSLAVLALRFRPPGLRRAQGSLNGAGKLGERISWLLSIPEARNSGGKRPAFRQRPSSRW
jgi:hypothetical protein